MARRPALGRGLAALVAEFPGDGTSLVDVDVGQIRPNPRQPRRDIDDESIEHLAASIREEGLVQPILVRPAGDGYEIVAGERRWRAAMRAGLRAMPALVRTTGERESLVLALAENVAREDLNPVEEARAYAVLCDELDLSQAEVARRVGKSRVAVANTLRLLDLPDEVLERIARGQLTEGHGRALLAARGQDERRRLARAAVARRWSVRDMETAARGEPGRPPPAAAGTVDAETADAVADAAWQSLGLRATVRASTRGGRVEIRFSTAEELARIAAQLRAPRRES